MLLLNGVPAGIVRKTLFTIALAIAALLLLQSLWAKVATKHAAGGRFVTLEAERKATAVRAAMVVARAAEARAAAGPALGRVESLRARVQIAGKGQLRVQRTGAAEAMLVPVPPLVIDRIEADSVALSALSVALTWDSRGMAALEERLVAETKARDAARLRITELERERTPRCGRRCGMVLGAAGVVALGLAVDQARRLVRP
jgi:hypothetical protein